ncbi:hypothetical protein KF913_11155 [Candidatus Obscuribacterales bacterium]|nr:hypothetical protein [Candidatus Obscuribacterales bacterium]
MSNLKRRAVNLLLSSALLSAGGAVADNAFAQSAPAKPVDASKSETKPTSIPAVKPAETADAKPPAQPEVKTAPATTPAKAGDAKPDGDASTPQGPKQEGKPGDAGMPGTGSPPPQAMVPNGPMRVDPTQVPQGPPGTPLKVQANLDIPQDPFVDSLFVVFNYLSLGAIAGAVIFGVLWFAKHRKRQQMIAAGLIPDEEDDDDDDEDDDEPVLVKSADASPPESKVESPDAAPVAVTPEVKAELVQEEPKTAVAETTVSESSSEATSGGEASNSASAGADENSSSSVNDDASEETEAAPAVVTSGGGTNSGSGKSGKGKKNRKKKS